MLKSGWGLVCHSQFKSQAHLSIGIPLNLPQKPAAFIFTAKFHSSVLQLLLKMQEQRLISLIVWCLDKYSTVLLNLVKNQQQSREGGRYISGSIPKLPAPCLASGRYLQELISRSSVPSDLAISVEFLLNFVQLKGMLKYKLPKCCLK